MFHNSTPFLRFREIGHLDYVQAIKTVAIGYCDRLWLAKIKSREKK